jgi:hypothetical protein
MTDPRPCPACSKPRSNARHYLCEGCWWTLPAPARGRLRKRDSKATMRLIELNRQLHDDVALHLIEITTP